MSTSDATADSKPESSAIGRLAHVIGQAARFEGDLHGLGKGERAALARLDPEGELRPHQIAALARAVVQAGLEPEHWGPECWRRWALIAHGMALTGQGKGALGVQLHAAGVSESRVTKLLTARGLAFRQLLPRLLRLLASREVAPNWYELGELIRHESRNEKKAEEIRMRIAARYFSAAEKSAAEPAA
ncbi:CRISPR-associated protein Cse2 [Halorhodospira abdelmalekii]|uniref:type I-E CRISPR-associated protein Cse2/CasB n=1 Tax=Halorhodospira abdelmalekii TaxID=421629 RepID=UPI001908AB8D|nr:type I-E CRISPR-associated protein Cse2/CasB [Halorhodospira abdelmalekii]MBK1734174.1 CRISPR-associated protein Cse2 [Halorhodospira abdelmalekii]